MERSHGGHALINRNSCLGLRLLLLSGGSALMGIGVAIAAASTFGADSVALLWEGMHIKFQVTLGTANLLFSLVFLLLVFLIDRKQIGIGTILSPLIEGIAIDICAFFFMEINIVFYQWMAMLTGIILIAVGTGIYAAADIGRGPYIGITFAMEKKYHWSLAKFRICLDVICLILGILFGASLSIGPIVSVLLMGILTKNSCAFVERTILQPYLLQNCRH